MEREKVEMTAEERREFDEFRAARAKKEAEMRAKEDREIYKEMVDSEIDSAIPMLLCLSEDIKDTKKMLIDNFRSVVDLKGEVIKTARDDQRSHTFTNSTGNKRITLGVYVTDGYRDTVEDGIAIVKEYIESLANDAKTKSLVGMVFRLLARDAKGTLKASRVLQLRKMAEESGSDRFLEGVRIIEESYQPAISKQFVRAEMKNEHGMWINIPLGMTEA